MSSDEEIMSSESENEIIRGCVDDEVEESDHKQKEETKMDVEHGNEEEDDEEESDDDYQRDSFVVDSDEEEISAPNDNEPILPTAKMVWSEGDQDIVKQGLKMKEKKKQKRRRL